MCPLAGTVRQLQLAKQWVPAGTRANHAAIGRLSFLPAGGGGGGGGGEGRKSGMSADSSKIL